MSLKMINGVYENIYPSLTQICDISPWYMSLLRVSRGSLSFLRIMYSNFVLNNEWNEKETEIKIARVMLRNKLYFYIAWCIESSAELMPANVEKVLKWIHSKYTIWLAKYPNVKHKEAWKALLIPGFFFVKSFFVDLENYARSKLSTTLNRRERKHDKYIFLLLNEVSKLAAAFSIWLVRRRRARGEKETKKTQKNQNSMTKAGLFADATSWPKVTEPFSGEMIHSCRRFLCCSTSQRLFPSGLIEKCRGQTSGTSVTWNWNTHKKSHFLSKSQKLYWKGNQCKMYRCYVFKKLSFVLSCIL